MKRKNKKIKKLVACLVCAVLLGSALWYVPNVLATTVESAPTESKAYSEWDATTPVNGNFEAGYAGMEVYGWTKTAFKYHSSDWEVTDAETAKSYCDAFSLTTTVEEDGNKMAEFYHGGAGYAAATSSPISVSGGTTCRVSFEYKTGTFTAVSDTNTNYLGMWLFIEEVDSEGNSTLTRSYTDNNETDGWKTCEKEFQTQSDTISVIIHLWMGGQMNMRGSVYFDDVTFEVYDDLNGNFDNVTYLADGGRVAGTAGPAGWTGASCTNGGVSFDTNSYQNHYTATVETIDGDSVLCYSVDKAAKQVGGYSYIMSPYIAVGANQSYSVKYDMMIDLVRGEPGNQKTRVRVVCYDANKGEIEGDYRGNEREIADSDWTTKYYSNTTPTNTAYIRIGFYAGKDYAFDTAYKLYFDNVAIRVNDTTLSDEWTAETCMEAGIPRQDDDDYTGNYGICTVNEGAEHEEALQLYVSRSNGILGGAVFYSKPISVTTGQSYTTTFDLKTENSGTTYYYDLNGTRYYTNETTFIDADGVEQATTIVNLFGASYVLRYLDNDGNVVSRDIAATGQVKTDIGWTSYSYDFTPPEGAMTVQVGLVIGGYMMNTCPDLMYTWDNILVMESEAYEEYTTDNDLLFVMLKEGNAVDATENESIVDVCDLIHMKKYTTGNTKSILKTADMNKNTLYNDDDITLLEWKLLGVTTTEQAQSVH